MEKVKPQVIFKCEDAEIKDALDRYPLSWNFTTTGALHVGDTLVLEGLDAELKVTKRQWVVTQKGTELRLFIQR